MYEHNAYMKYMTISTVCAEKESCQGTLLSKKKQVAVECE